MVKMKTKTETKQIIKNLLVGSTFLFVNELCILVDKENSIGILHGKSEEEYPYLIYNFNSNTFNWLNEKAIVEVIDEVNISY